MEPETDPILIRMNALADLATAMLDLRQEVNRVNAATERVTVCWRKFHAELARANVQPMPQSVEPD